LRKTVRYFFQITPFDNERTRDRIELIDSVEEKLQELHLQIDLKVEEEGRKVVKVIIYFSLQKRSRLSWSGCWRQRQSSTRPTP
jgi:hypothetical protein